MQTLFKLLERGAHLPVRVQGPIGLRHAEYPWLKYNVLVAFVGGIGVRKHLKHHPKQASYCCPRGAFSDLPFFCWDRACAVPHGKPKCS